MLFRRGCLSYPVLHFLLSLHRIYILVQHGWRICITAVNACCDRTLISQLSSLSLKLKTFSEVISYLDITLHAREYFDMYIQIFCGTSQKALVTLDWLSMATDVKNNKDTTWHVFRIISSRVTCFGRTGFLEDKTITMNRGLQVCLPFKDHTSGGSIILKEAEYVLCSCSALSAYVLCFRYMQYPGMQAWNIRLQKTLFFIIYVR